MEAVAVVPAAVAVPVPREEGAVACPVHRVEEPVVPVHPEDPRLRVHVLQEEDRFHVLRAEEPLRDRPLAQDPLKVLLTADACHLAPPPRVHPREAGRSEVYRIARVVEQPAVLEAVRRTDRERVSRAVQAEEQSIVRVPAREAALVPAMLIISSESAVPVVPAESVALAESVVRVAPVA